MERVCTAVGILQRLIVSASNDAKEHFLNFVTTISYFRTNDLRFNSWNKMLILKRLLEILARFE